jgi:hypothetical protein
MIKKDSKLNAENAKVTFGNSGSKKKRTSISISDYRNSKTNNKRISMQKKGK